MMAVHRPWHADLTPRELQAVRLVAAALTDKEIALMLDSNVPCVKYYLISARKKLGCPNRVALALRVVSDGLLEVANA